MMPLFPHNLCAIALPLLLHCASHVPSKKEWCGLVWSKCDTSKWGTGLTVRLVLYHPRNIFPPRASMFSLCLYLLTSRSHLHRKLALKAAGRVRPREWLAGKETDHSWRTSLQWNTAGSWFGLLFSLVFFVRQVSSPRLTDPHNLSGAEGLISDWIIPLVFCPGV